MLITFDNTQIKQIWISQSEASLRPRTGPDNFARGLGLPSPNLGSLLPRAARCAAATDVLRGIGDRGAVTCKQQRKMQMSVVQESGYYNNYMNYMQKPCRPSHYREEERALVSGVLRSRKGQHAARSSAYVSNRVHCRRSGDHGERPQQPSR